MVYDPISSFKINEGTVTDSLSKYYNNQSCNTSNCRTNNFYTYRSASNKRERDNGKSISRDYLRDVSLRHPEMKAPKVHDSFSWGKQRSQKTSTKDAELISAAASGLNIFSNDGSFLHKVNQHSKEPNVPIESAAGVEDLSANKLVAKAMQLRMKGKLEESEKLMVRQCFPEVLSPPLLLFSSID
ncbi:hypothetical protein ACOSQ3_004462 [Xanthoceras sorbifolium]